VIAEQRKSNWVTALLVGSRSALRARDYLDRVRTNLSGRRLDMQSILIMGAAGKDFHVFNTVYRDDPDVEVVAFTATQIPGIEDRRYPPELAGPLYPEGIPIRPESELEELIHKHAVDLVVFAYSDVSYDYVQEKEWQVEACGARFEVAPTNDVMLRSGRPVIAVTAVRTGCGKSQTSRWLVGKLQREGYRIVAVRHPMPYGDLAKQAVQRFATLDDLRRHECTIEEMEEYEPYIRAGLVVFAGVDYAAILKQAEAEADIILWDGGNNDVPFYKPDLWLTVVDPHRAGDELASYPGRENFERADVIVLNKLDSATPEQVAAVEANIEQHNPKAIRVYAESILSVADVRRIRGARVLAIEDGPTLTHGGMTFGAAALAARRFGAAELVCPRPFAVGEIRATLERYPHVRDVLPAVGYGAQQIADLEATIEATDADLVLVGTPIDLTRILRIRKPFLRVQYDLAPREPEVLLQAVRRSILQAQPVAHG
jgi:predicted GTPase